MGGYNVINHPKLSKNDFLPIFHYHKYAEKLLGMLKTVLNGILQYSRELKPQKQAEIPF